MLDEVRNFELLGNVGVLPPHADVAQFATADSCAAGLLAVWRESLRTTSDRRRSRAARIHSSLQAAVNAGAELTFEIPGCSREINERWLGRRAYWWPRGVIRSRCVGVVSSRLRREPEAKASVVRALRLSLTGLDTSSERLVVSDGTSLSDYLEHCAKMFELPVLRVCSPKDRTMSPPWLDELVPTGRPNPEVELLLSRSVPSVENNSSIVEGEASFLKNVPTRDRVIALLSDRLFVLTLRENGNWWKLLQAGFKEGLWNPGSVRAAVREGLCTQSAADMLQDHGAVRWYLSADNSLSDEDTSEESSGVSDPDQGTASRSARCSAAEDELLAELAHSTSSTDWLIHWTRDARSEWPGETHGEYLTSALLGDSTRDRTAFRTLQRMINERLVRASPGSTRTGDSVVCLSGTSLVELAAQRVFRRHRGRWDFEHYGIGIRASFVRAIGGRPVIYGDTSTWETLPPGERLWFQTGTSQSSEKPIDWTIENEWRLAGDLHLGSVPEQDVFAYCATEEEAAWLRTLCPWRVVSVEKLLNERRDTRQPDD